MRNISWALHSNVTELRWKNFSKLTNTCLYSTRMYMASRDQLSTLTNAVHAHGLLPQLH